MNKLWFRPCNFFPTPRNRQDIKKGDLVSKPWWDGKFYRVVDVKEKRGLLFLSPEMGDVHIPYDLNFDWIVKRKTK